MAGPLPAIDRELSSESPLLAPLRLFWLHRWILLAFTVLGGVIGLGYCLIESPSYRASASLLIEPKDADVVKIDKVYDPSSVVREYHRTQYELLQSRELIDSVVTKLQLAKHPLYVEKYKPGPEGPTRQRWRDRMLQHVQDWVPFLYDGLNLAALRSRGETLTEALLDDLRIDPVPNSYMVKVVFDSEDAALAATVANAIVDQYLSRERAARTGLGYEAADLLTQRVEESRKALQDSEKALQAFLEKEDLINVGGVRSLVEDEITERTRRLREAQAQREQLANVYGRIKAAGENVEALQDIPTIQQDPLVQSTKGAYLAAKEDLDQIAPRYGDKHPTRQAAKARYDAAARAYFTQLRIASQGIRNNYELASKTAGDLQSQVYQSTGRIQNLDRKDYQLKVLQRDVDTNRELYETFLKRFKETQATADLELGNARIIDRAVPPLKAHWPKPLLICAGAVLLGLILGAALVLVREALDNTVGNAEQLEELSGVPVLCSLPHVTGREQSLEKLSRLEVDDPKSIYAEGVRTLRTSILLNDREGQRMRKLMICSSLPAEGKTTISSNLAAVLAERERVLLVDADLRRPRIGALFGISPLRPGLAQLLAGETTLEEAVTSSDIAGIDLLPAGGARDNPQVMLASDRFFALIDELAKRYDRVVFDTAPCQLVSDALLFAKHMDGVILVARSGSTARKVLASTARRLRNAEAPLIGAVLNDLDLRRGAGYEGSYHYRYGYYG